jgi:hypothetical protein
MADKIVCTCDIPQEVTEKGAEQFVSRISLEVNVNPARLLGFPTLIEAE